jgi:hypothetical protein
VTVEGRMEKTGGAGKLEEAAVQEFASKLRGELIAPGDEDYDEARAVYNAMIDKRPRLIARCRNAADVIAGVNFARENGLLLAVRGAGHNVAGLGTCDDGLVLDFSLMKSVHVDPVKRTARAEPGCALGDLDHAAHAFGLATPAGAVSTTGIAGLTLGGGFGHLTRKYGLTIDNLLSVDVVTADGRFLRASAEENEDLFWALRGGGGNFGVVTSFEYRLHPVGEVLGGPIFYPVEKAPEVLRFFREYIDKAPEDMSAFFAFQIGPPAPFIPEDLQGVMMCALIVCYVGPPEKDEEIMKPLREITPPALDLVQRMPYPALQSLFDDLLPAGLQNYWKADFSDELTDGAIDVHCEYGPQASIVHSSMHIYPLNGAVHRVGASETAFPNRDSKFATVILAIYPDPADTPKMKSWVRDYWSALQPHSSEGAYVNFLGAEEADRIAPTYQDNYDRLVKIKSKYDPENLFRVNQNIPPRK